MANNAGSLTIQNDAQLLIAGAFTNAGSLTVDAGSLQVQGDFTNSGTVELRNGSSLQAGGGYVQSSGSTLLDHATLSAAGLLDLQAGLLSGSGIIQGSVQNAGAIAVGGSGAAGELIISGNYVQTATGELDIDLGGIHSGTDYDQLAIGGTATLDGTLNVNLINGFQPIVGDSFAVLIFGSRSGDFAIENGLDLGGGLHLNPQYHPSSLALGTIGGGDAVPPGRRTSSPGTGQPAAGDQTLGTSVAGHTRTAVLLPTDVLAKSGDTARACVDAFFESLARLLTN
jgi:hypothetical protein